MPLSSSLAALAVVLFAVACSGSNETSSETGGASQGGSSHAGNNGTSGKATGGSVANGGSINAGGSVATGGTTFDPSCPDTQPSGSCDAQDEGISCQYDEFTGCLCYSSTYGYCQQVDPTCPSAGGTGGTGGTGGAGGAGGASDAGGAGAGGVGGFQAKIAAPPPRNMCSCADGAWGCNLIF